MYTFSLTALLIRLWHFASFLIAPILLLLFYFLFSHEITQIDTPQYKGKLSALPALPPSFELADLFEIEGRLFFLGKSVRPDLQDNPWVFTLDGNPFAIAENRALYLHPTSGANYLFQFEKSDRPTPFFLIVEKGTLILSLGSEKKVFSPVKQNLPSSFTETIHLLPPDLLLSLLHPSQNMPYRIAIGDKIIPCEDKCLIAMEKGQSIGGPPSPSSALIRFSLLNEKSALIEKWEPYAIEGSKETLRIIKSTPQESINNLITPLKRRSLTNVECQLSASKILLKKGDWLIPSKGRLIHLGGHKDQLKWLVGNPTGEVFVSLGTIKTGNKWSLLLHHYDRYHGSYAEVHLPIQPHHKK